MASDVATAREALRAELLQGADARVRRLEQVGETLAARMEQAATDAAGKAFLAARLNFESVIDNNAAKLTEAGRHAAAQIGNQLNHNAARAVAVNLALERKIGRFELLLDGFAFIAGAGGGFVRARLAGL